MKKFCLKHTALFCVLIMIIAAFSNLITGFIQNTHATNLTNYYLIEAVCKYAFAVIPLLFMIKFGYIKSSNSKNMLKGFVVGTFVIIFCIPNIAVFALVDSSHFFVNWGVVFSIVFACLAIGLLEETAMRGVVLPLLCEKWKNEQHTYWIASIVSSLLFACAHLNWSLRYLISNGNLPLEQLLGNLYQVLYTFCFGIFAAGLVLYSRSIWPIVFWHGVCDVSAFISDGIISRSAILFFYQGVTITLQTVLDAYGIPLREEFIEGIINALLLAVGALLIRKAEKIYKNALEVSNAK